MRTQAIRTKSPTGTVKIKRIIKYVFIIIGALTIFTAPLVHMAFPSQNKEVSDYEEELDAKTSDIINSMDELRSWYDDGRISAIEYIEANDILESNLKSQRSWNEELLRLKEDQVRYFGWQTKRVFWIGFGIRLPLLLLAIVISFLVAQIRTEDRYLSATFDFMLIAIYAMAFYHVVWCFWYSQDYPLSTYKMAAIAFCILAAIISISLIKHFEFRTNRLTRIIRSLFTFIYTETDKEGYVKDELRERYTKRRIELVDKTLDNEV